MFKVCLDPGHGGGDRANRGYSGAYVEADGVLTMARAAREVLTKAGIAVTMTRDADVSLGLPERSAVANQVEADAFVSIHSNAGPAAAQGTETYVRWADEASHRLGRAVQQAVVSALGTVDRGVRIRAYDSETIYPLASAPTPPGVDYYGILRRATVPTCLVEVMFHSNRDEELRLQDPATVQRIGEAIAAGIMAYLGMDQEKLQLRARVAALETLVRQLQAANEDLVEKMRRAKEILS